ncbi:MAG: hypothetical protein Fur0018_18130 [Anaerolineales bacterium]
MQYARQFTQAYHNAPWRRQTQWLGMFLLALVALALVASLYLSVSSRAATLGRETMNMQAEIERLRRANADLTVQLAQLTAADAMQARAAALGLQPASPEQIQYVVVPGYRGRQTARLAPQATFQVAAPLVQPAFSESLLDWARIQLAPLGWSQVLGALPAIP